MTLKTVGKITFALVGLALAGCNTAPSETASSASGAPPASGAKKQIAAILMQDDQFFRLNQIGMEEAAKANDVQLLSASAGGALDKELNLVDTYAAQGVGAILISPLNSKGSAPALERAAKKGVKIVVYNGALDKDFPVASIVSDQVSLGETTGKNAAQWIQTKKGGQAKIALIEFNSLLPQSALRVKGFKQGLKGVPGAQIVAEQDAWLAPQAEKVVTDILNAHPDLDMVWAANEGGTIGAVTAVKNAGKAGKVAVFGTDMSDQMGDFLMAKDDILQSVTGQKPLEMGAAAVETAIKALNGKPVEKNKVLGGTLFKRGDLAAIKAFQASATKAAK